MKVYVAPMIHDMVVGETNFVRVFCENCGYNYYISLVKSSYIDKLIKDVKNIICPECEYGHGNFKSGKVDDSSTELSDAEVKRMLAAADKNIGVLVGKTLISCVLGKQKDVVEFETTSGSVYELYHEPDCCESVFVEDICGDLQDLVGSPILQAEEVSNKDNESLPNYNDYSYTWTFYKLATVKGSVTIRWYGTSNGYYSESVYFRRVK